MPRDGQLTLTGFLLLTVGMFAREPYQQSSQTSGQRAFISPDAASQFTYPSSYSLYTGNEADHLNYMPVCQSAVACVLYPKEKFAETNFEAASFQEREIDNATTEKTCLTSPMRAENVPEFDIPANDPRRVINGVSFLHGRSFEGGLGHSMGTDLYRAFHKGRCYELSINVATVSIGSFDPGAMKEFTREDLQGVRNELTTILDSFRFLK
jgi:hypothetical protein